MNAKPLILVVDDDERTLCVIKDTLEYLRCDVEFARNGDEALKKARELKPDMIILDIMMPGLTGYEVCDQLKADPETRSIRIILLSAWSQQNENKGSATRADYFIAKPYDVMDLENRVRHWLKRSKYVPFPVPDTQSECTFKLSCRPELRMKISVSGSHKYDHWSEDLLKINEEDYWRKGKHALADDSRLNSLTREEELYEKISHSQNCGRELYQKFFRDHPRVGEDYKEFLGRVGRHRNLHLHFESTQSFLRVPLEFLFEKRGQGGDHLILQHPLSRSITDVLTKRISLSPDFFNELRLEGLDLRILLIASNTDPVISGVDQEIADLENDLRSMFTSRRISTSIDTIHSDQATYERICKTLRQCEYHIIHYAGHGTHDLASPASSNLYFWEQEDRQGKVIDLSTVKLKELLEDSDVRFVYLSCCYGTATARPAQLLADPYLGIADGIIQAGVPSVLGFRRPVSDLGAPKLARAFYESLATQGQIDTALLDARRAVYADDYKDVTWLSPILVMQF